MMMLKFIPWIMAIAAVLCAVCSLRQAWRPLAAWCVIAGLGICLALTIAANLQMQPLPKLPHTPVPAAAHAPDTADPARDHAHTPADHHTQPDADADGVQRRLHGYTVEAFRWINVGWITRHFETEAQAKHFITTNRVHEWKGQDPGTGHWVVEAPIIAANFHYYIDMLTLVMLFVVCGIGGLVAIYAAGYMKGDRGYARFFAFVGLFIFSMTSMIMSDNLILLYLGWEGVGLASYLLIGFYYDKPHAVAAAKKAFIVNRIGDLGFALGIFLIFNRYGTVIIPDIIEMAAESTTTDWRDTLIPFLLMLGAFGKSAQFPLYVWLPDAMAGPTPVSALIHAATMVTSGVYMIARLHAVFELSPYALPTVMVVGAIGALFAGAIALCQYDLKKVFAYSTISQLGYMFMGVGIDETYAVFGAILHLISHAFFKALLFLTSGNVMHGMAGQTDLRKMSGMRKHMPVTAVLMLIGCLSLAAFPFTAGFFSKDAILAGIMAKGLEDGSSFYVVMVIIGLTAAFITPLYAFRVWFRVFMGPTQYEMGDDHHGDDDHGTAHDHGHDPAHGEAHVAHEHLPHEASRLMLAPLILLAVGALFSGILLYSSVKTYVKGSTAAINLQEAHANLAGMDIHLFMQLVSGVIAIISIALAAYFHWLNREAAPLVANRVKGLVYVLQNKYFLDEINDTVIVRPLRTLGQVFFTVDRVIVDNVVSFVGFVPRLMGLGVQPLQRGMLQGYGLGMLGGVAIIVLVVMRLISA